MIRFRRNREVCTDLSEDSAFIYRAPLDHGFTEHEYDHVLIGYYDGSPRLNPNEADDWRWITIDKLKEEIKTRPEQFTYWLKKWLAPG